VWRIVARFSFASFVGGVVTAVGLVSAVPAAWDGVSRLLGIPVCMTFGDRYYFYDGVFVNEGERWIEYQQANRNEFVEQSRDRNFIILRNMTPRPDTDRWRSMLVRIPACGGSIELTFQVPEEWRPILTSTRSIPASREAFYAEIVARGRAR
jgi:hypothetical protein